METNDLTGFYNETLFFSEKNNVTIKETDKGATVKSATINCQNADFDYSTEDIWSAGENLYRKESGGYKFRKKCDGFLICRTENKNYLIWIELKSGFSEVFNKAIYQLSACYVKMKSYLRTISTYKAEDFEEIAIVVSHPEDDKSQSIEENDSVLSRRNTLVSEETPSDKCRKRYRKTGTITIDAADFDSGKLHLVSDILPHNLRVFHITTKNEQEKIDLKLLFQN